MASNRHLGRIIVLQSLYEYEFRSKAGDATADIATIVAKNIEPYAKALGDTEFVYGLAQDVSSRFDALDEVLQPMAPEWPLSTIAAIDRNILRMGLYELQSSSETVPPKVAINEAVELAKAFGSDNSSKFVNGVLGTAYRQIYNEVENSGEEEQHEEKTQAEPAVTAETAETGATEGGNAAGEVEEATADSEGAVVADADSGTNGADASDGSKDAA